MDNATVVYHLQMPWLHWESCISSLVTSKHVHLETNLFQ